MIGLGQAIKRALLSNVAPALVERGKCFAHLERLESERTTRLCNVYTDFEHRTLTFERVLECPTESSIIFVTMR